MSTTRRTPTCEISRRCHGYSRLLKPSCSLPSQCSRRQRLIFFFIYLASTSAHPLGEAGRRRTRRRPGRRRGTGGWSRCGRSAAAASTTGSTPTPDGPSTPCPLTHSLTHSLTHCLLAGCLVCFFCFFLGRFRLGLPFLSKFMWQPAVS